MSIELFGFNIDNYSFNEALIEAKKLIDGSCVAQVITINPEMLEYTNKNSDFADIIKNAEMVIPDGIGVKLALKINGHNAERIAGVDFAKALLKEAAINNIPVAIIGAEETVLIKACENLQNEIENLNIVYKHNGYFKNEGGKIQEKRRRA